MGDIGSHKSHIRLYWNMDVGRFMLVFLLSFVLFWNQRTVTIKRHALALVYSHLDSGKS